MIEKQDSKNAPQRDLNGASNKALREAPDSELWRPSLGPLRKTNIFQKGPKVDLLGSKVVLLADLFLVLHFVRCAEALQATVWRLT